MFLVLVRLVLMGQVKCAVYKKVLQANYISLVYNAGNFNYHVIDKKFPVKVIFAHQNKEPKD